MFNFFKHTPSFAPVSPYTPIFFCFLPILPVSSCPLPGLCSDRNLKDLEFHVSKLCTLSLGTIMRSGVICKEKNRRWTEDRGNKRRRQGERSIHMSCGQIQQVGLSNLPMYFESRQIVRSVRVYCMQWWVHISFPDNTIHEKPACNSQLLGSFKGLIHLWQWLNECLLPYPYSAGNKHNQINHWRQENSG